jgi:hypothetical protein
MGCKIFFIGAHSVKIMVYICIVKPKRKRAMLGSNSSGTGLVLYGILCIGLLVVTGNPMHKMLVSLMP